MTWAATPPTGTGPLTPPGAARADAMATALLDAHHAACAARDAGQSELAPEAVARVRNHYHSALARGETDNHGDRSSLAHGARTLIRRMRRQEDLILRFVVDLTVPSRTVKQLGTSGPSRSSNGPPVVAGGPWPASSTSRSCRPTCRPRPSGASTPLTFSNDCSPPAPGYRPLLNPAHAASLPYRQTNPARIAHGALLPAPDADKRPAQRLPPELNSYHPADLPDRIPASDVAVLILCDRGSVGCGVGADG